jgi:hypothetical protein
VVAAVSGVTDVTGPGQFLRCLWCGDVTNVTQPGGQDPGDECQRCEIGKLVTEQGPIDLGEWFVCSCGDRRFLLREPDRITTDWCSECGRGIADERERALRTRAGLPYPDPEDEVETFKCKCGDYSYPLVKTDDEEDVWCECGLRIEPQREVAQQIRDEEES